MDDAGRIGVGAVEVPEEDGNIVDKGRVPPPFDGVSALGLIVVVRAETGCGCAIGLK